MVISRRLRFIFLRQILFQNNTVRDPKRPEDSANKHWEFQLYGVLHLGHLQGDATLNTQLRNTNWRFSVNLDRGVYDEFSNLLQRRFAYDTLLKKKKNIASWIEKARGDHTVHSRTDAHVLTTNRLISVTWYSRPKQLWVDYGPHYSSKCVCMINSFLNVRIMKTGAFPRIFVY